MRFHFSRTSTTKMSMLLVATFTGCGAGKVMCDKGACIPLSHKCDGFMNCQDGTDEKHCGDVKERCGGDDFLCENIKVCITRSWKCDGHDHCGDGSDEKNCG